MADEIIRVPDPFKPIYELQNGYSRRNEIPCHPLIVNSEPTNICNYDCLFCIGKHQMRRPKGYMTLEQFKTVAQSAKDAGALAMRLIGWGEPFLNKDTYEMIKTINSLGMTSHVTTNGLLADIEKILDSGLQSIYFSMQGLTPQEYARLRNTDKYPVFERNITGLVEERNRLGLKYPFVQVTTSVTNEPIEEQQAFIDFWKSRVDSASISYTWLERLEDKSKVQEWVKREHKQPRHFACNEVRARLNVFLDGTVTPCCEDCDGVFNIGNAFTTPLQEIWDSPTAAGIRLILSEPRGNQDMFVLCQKCQLSHVFRGNLNKKE